MTGRFNAVKIGLNQLKHFLEHGLYKDRDKLLADIAAYEWVLSRGLEEEYLKIQRKNRSLSVSQPVREVVARLKKELDI